MTGAEWEDAVVAQRSNLDDRVWVPFTTGDWAGDQSCFLNAGSLRAVKAWALTRVSGRTRWRHDGDAWVLQVAR